ncbi:MAG: zinc ribbon domain-containing protein [Lachnospiraceae bacterium]|nr:zinc ribbon domain-containing protein [Lachnospiraceae bacterium]
MRPDYAMVMYDEFIKHFPNKYNAEVVLNRTIDEMNKSFKIVNEGKSLIILNCIAYDYITEKIVDDYYIRRGEETIPSKMNYAQMMPITLYYYAIIISPDIEEISDFEDYVNEILANERNCEVELKDKEWLQFKFSIDGHKRGDATKSTVGVTADKTMYVSQFRIKGENCIIYHERYKEIELDLIKGLKDEVVKRLSKLEEMKELLVEINEQDPRLSDIDVAWNGYNSLFDIKDLNTTYKEIYNMINEKECTYDKALEFIREKNRKKQEKLQRQEARKGDMYCYNCGSKLVDGGKFCTKCGCKIKDSDNQICEDVNYEAEKKTEVQEVYVTALKRREMEKYIKNNFSPNEKIVAIKYVIKETGWGLKKGKEFVDSIEFDKRLREDSVETVHHYEYDDYYEPEQYQSNRGGFISSLIRECAENSNKRNSGKRAKPDLIGSHGCIEGKKVGNFRRSCSLFCPLWNECSRGSSH